MSERTEKTEDKELYFDGLRIEAARRHVESVKTTYRITGHVPRLSHAASNSFLSGWDAAMKAKYPELLEENTKLHNLLFDHDLGGGVAKMAEVNALRELAFAVDEFFKADTDETKEWETDLLQDALRRVHEATEQDKPA